MPGPERFPPDDPREWLERARSSLRHAEARVAGVHLNDLCWQAQEAAEKAIKAVMVARNVRYPYVHDPRVLMATLRAAGYQVPAAVRRSGRCAAFRSRLRYPGYRSVSERGYARRLRCARQVIEWAAGEIDVVRRTGLVREPTPVPYACAPPVGIGRAPSPALLRTLVARVVRAVAPERIILFGSGARGGMGPHSDIDLLVVVAEPFDEEDLYAAIDDSLDDLAVPVDVILASPEILERYRDSWCLVYCPAQEEGRVLYERERGFIAADEGGPPVAGSRSVAHTGL